MFQSLGKVKKGEAPNAGEVRQDAVTTAFGDSDWPERFTAFDDFWNHYRYNLEQRALKPTTQIRKMLFDVLGVHDPDADPIRDSKGRYEPDTDLRDNENVPLPPVGVTFEPDPTDRLTTADYRQTVDRYVETEVLPWVPDAWVDYEKTKLGYEIPFTREFYVYTPPRPLHEIDTEIKQLETEIQDLLVEVTE